LGLLTKPSVVATVGGFRYEILKKRFLTAEELTLQKDGSQFKISFVLPKLEDDHFASSHHLWIDPEKGFNTTRYVMDYPGKIGEVVGTAELDWEKQQGWWVLANLTIEHGRAMPQYRLRWSFDWQAINEPFKDEDALKPNSLIGPSEEALLAAFGSDGGDPVDVGVVSNKSPDNIAEQHSRLPVSRLLLIAGVILAVGGLLIVTLRGIERPNSG
jgi:hypothetical protein